MAKTPSFTIARVRPNFACSARDPAAGRHRMQFGVLNRGEVKSLRTALAVFSTLAALWPATVWAGPDTGVAQEVLALERRAMDGWLKGDPDPQMALFDPQVTYFHAAVVEERIDGLAAVKQLFEPYRGRPLFDDYEILNPKVQECGEIAILTYRLARHLGGVTTFWNSTQVYRKTKDGWRVIHSHWSVAKSSQGG